jgi:hypothetical protein
MKDFNPQKTKNNKHKKLTVFCGWRVNGTVPSRNFEQKNELKIKSKD